MRVAFAPNYETLVPYQRLLADALLSFGVTTEYLKITSRGLPLARSIRRQGADVLHLHWPEDFFLKGDRWDLMRKAVFAVDTYLAERAVPLVYTMHDLYPVRDSHTYSTRAAVKALVRNASALLVHSSGCRSVASKAFGIPEERMDVIPIGDLSCAYGKPQPRAMARSTLGLGERKVCLAFGAVLSNKGLEPLARFWAQARPDAILAIVGKDYERELAERLRALAGSAPNMLLDFGFQSDEQLNCWFSAADCAVINYESIFSSGVACLARSWGLPILLPEGLTTIDLDEPHPLVLRYRAVEDGFAEALARALSSAPDFDAAESWRVSTAWDKVAEETERVYRRVRTSSHGPNAASRA